MKIGVIIGSTRNGRVGDQVGHWIARHISHEGITAEIVDLAEANLPFFDSETHPAMANKSYDDPAAQAWSDLIDSFDAYIFVTPEYNHSVPAAMKNAFDWLYSEWAHKPVAFAGYGHAGGVRAVEHWRAIVANAHMFDARGQLSCYLETDFTAGVFTPFDGFQTALDGIVVELARLNKAAQLVLTSA